MATISQAVGGGGIATGLWVDLQIELLCFSSYVFYLCWGRGCLGVLGVVMGVVGGLLGVAFVCSLFPPSLSTDLALLWVVFEMVVATFLVFPFVFGSQFCYSVLGLFLWRGSEKRKYLEFCVMLFFWCLFHWSTSLFF